MNINNIKIGDVVIYRDGIEGKVTKICEKVIDGVNYPSKYEVLHRARIFTETENGLGRYITHRQDGVSHDCADSDIIGIKGE